MGVLHGPTGRNEKLQPLAGAQAVLVAVFSDGQALHQLHDEVRMTGRRRPSVENAGNVGVIQHGEGLPFDFEAGDDFTGVHTRLYEFQCNTPSDRFFLVSHVDDAEAPFANLFQ